MEQFSVMPTNWKTVSSLDEVYQMIDYGLVLKRTEIRGLQKRFDQTELQDIVRHFAVRFAERVETRISQEILVESLLVLLTFTNDEALIHTFIEELLLQSNYVEASLSLVEMAVSLNEDLLENGSRLLAMAVALICELGLFANQIRKVHPGKFPEVDRILKQISTYLLSLSNLDNSVVRLSLIHYFGFIEDNSMKFGFNRIMSRFGYTVLEQTFAMLFNKRTEGVALQYLLENIPYVLEGDYDCQKIVFETWKYFLLKTPDRFLLFIGVFASYIGPLEDERLSKVKEMFLQHLFALYGVLSEVNHVRLGKKLATIIQSFYDENRDGDALDKFFRVSKIRDTFKKLMMKNSDSESGSSQANPTVKRAKRGRKPSFTKLDTLNTIHQVTYLGQRFVARVS